MKILTLQEQIRRRIFKLLGYPFNIRHYFFTLQNFNDEYVEDDIFYTITTL